MTLREKLFFLQGQLEALGYPFVQGEASQAYFDLWESVRLQYEEIVKEVLEVMSD